MKRPIHFLQEKSPKLQALLRCLSRARFEAVSGRKVLTTSDHPTPDDFVYGSHQTIIQIAAKDLRVTFKSHFTHFETQSLLKKNGLKPIYDLFMEYSNLVAGGLSQHLHTNGIVSGISLPMATSGFDELIASDNLRSTSYLDYWVVKGEDFQFTCTAQVDFLGQNGIDDFKFEEDKIEEGSAIEFL